MIGPTVPGQEGSVTEVTQAQNVAFAGEPTLELRVLVERYVDFVFRSLRRLGVPDAALDDAVQKVWIVVSDRGEPVREGGARSLLFSIALRVASDARRTARRRRQVNDDGVIGELVDASPLPDENVARRQARAILDEILDAMDDDLRVVFVLFELEQMSSPEIAAAIDVPVGTVASRLRRARESFQSLARKRAPGGTR